MCKRYAQKAREYHDRVRHTENAAQTQHTHTVVDAAAGAAAAAKHVYAFAPMLPTLYECAAVRFCV